MTGDDAALEVGLLECDHVVPHLLGVEGDYADMFARLFSRHAPQVRLVRHDMVGGEVPSDPLAHDAWLVTGSRHSVFDDLPWVEDLLSFIRKVHRAGGVLVGVCFGHQAIAHALGGQTARSERGWCVGVHRSPIAQERSWMGGAHPDLGLLMAHQDRVCSLPPGATVLSGSGHCDVAMFEVDGRMLGIQGHPELTPDYAAALLDERVDRIPPDVLAAARATLAHLTDEALVAGWIAGFIAAAPGNRPSRRRG